MSSYTRSEKESWFQAIDSALGKDLKKYPSDRRADFQKKIFELFHMEETIAKQKFPANQEIGPVIDAVQAINQRFRSILGSKEKLQLVNAAKNDDFSIQSVASYLFELENSLKALKTSKPGPDNRQALYLCRFICDVFVICFGDLPSTSPQSPGEDGVSSPYERVCLVIQELSGVKLPWTTQRDAIERWASL